MFVCLHQSTVSSGLWLYWRTYKRSIYTRNLDILANNCFVLLQFSNSAFYCWHVTCEPFELHVFVMSHFSGKSVHSDTAMWLDFLPLFIPTSCLARKAMFAHQSLFFSVSWKELSPTHHTLCQANNTTLNGQKVSETREPFQSFSFSRDFAN